MLPEFGIVLDILTIALVELFTISIQSVVPLDSQWDKTVFSGVLLTRPKKPMGLSFAVLRDTCSSPTILMHG